MRAALLVLTLFTATTLCVCTYTIPPTDTLGTQLQSILSAHSSASEANVCLQAGTYRGCGNTLLSASGGGLVTLSGVSQALTHVNCENLDSFVVCNVAGCVLESMTVSNVSSWVASMYGNANFVVSNVTGNNYKQQGSFIVSSSSATLVVYNANITGYSIRGISGADCDLSIYNSHISDIDAFTGNSAVVLRTTGSLNVYNTTFINCLSAGSSAIRSEVSTVVRGCVFASCTSTNGDGGAIEMLLAPPYLIVTDTTFTNVYADGQGSALRAISTGHVTMRNVLIKECYGKDGGTEIHTGDLHNVTFDSSRVGDGVGAGFVVYDGGAVVLTDVWFVNGSALVAGAGGLFVSSGATVTATNCVFVYNTAQSGAAVSSAGEFTCIGCVFQHNTGTIEGIVSVTGSGQLTLYACQVDNNNPASTATVSVTGTGGTHTLTNSTFSDVSDAAPLVSLNTWGAPAAVVDSCDFPLMGDSERIYSSSSMLTVRNTRFGGCVGGGTCIDIFSDATSLVVTNSSFEGFANQWGVYSSSGDYAEVSYCFFRFVETPWEVDISVFSAALFSHNSIANCSNSVVRSVPATIEYCDFQFVTSTTDGGALSITDSAALTIRNSQFADVTTTTRGGAIYIYNGAATLTNLVITRAIAGSTGGAVYTGGTGSVHVSDSRVSSSVGLSSILYLSFAFFPDYGSVTVENTVLTDNSAAFGDLVYGFTGNSSLTNITAVDNSKICGVSASSFDSHGYSQVDGLYLEGGSDCAGTSVLATGKVDGRISVSDILITRCSGDTMSGVYIGSTYGVAHVVDVSILDSAGVALGLTCNRVTCYASGIRVTDSSATQGAITTNAWSVTIASNVTVRGLSGSAVYVFAGGTATFSNSSISRCSATSGAGAYTEGSLTFANSSLYDNTAALGGASMAVGEYASVSFVNCTVSGNTASASGAAAICVSSALCSASSGTLVSGSRGGAVFYALFGGRLFTDTVAFFDNSHDALAGYGSGGINMTNSVVYGSAGGAVGAIATPLSVVGSVVTDNSGAYAVRTYNCDSVDIVDSFVSANSGTGFLCESPAEGFVGRWSNSVVCDNEVDYSCSSECGFVGGGTAVCSPNSTDCGNYCDANTEYCVSAAAVFAGPYDGCPVCGGACDTGSYDCPTFAVCVDAAGGDYTCACPSGFAGNGTTNCTDANECALGLDNCSPLANCTNTPGSFVCDCNDGYRGSGVWCVDIDECGTGSHDCVTGAVCTNSEGSHVCECDNTRYGVGTVECTPCPANSHSFVGARNVTDCVCDTNTFNVANEIGADCVPCPAGRYVADAGGVLVCIECPADTYSDSANTGGACTACPPSTTTNGVEGSSSVRNCTCAEGLALVVVGGVNGTAQCERYCPAGTSRPEPDAQCVDCPIGRYGNQPNQPECTACPLNSLTAGVGSVSVANCSCKGGYFAPDSAVGVDCERRCPAGSYRPSPFSLDCPVCGIGTYSDTDNVDECSPCPNNAVTPTSNSTAITDCECPPNYYTPERERGTECRPCPSGAKCKGGVSWPVARKGYIYVEGDDGSAGFAECVPFEACAGNGQCAQGYTGNLCERCKPNYYRLDGLCYKCQNNAWLIVLACGLALFVFCAVLVWFNSQDRAINKFASIVIGVNALQIAGMYGRLNLNWPPLAQRFFAVLSLVNFNIELVSPECAVSVNDPFILRWLLTMFFPVLVVAIFAALAAIGSALMACRCCGHDPTVSKWNPRYLRHTCIRAFYQLMTIGYLPLSAAVFEFFYCVKDASGERVISTARQTVCYTPTYWGLFPVALLCFALYPIGVPLFCGFLLKTKREKLGMIKFSLRYGFLVGRFDSRYYYFELAVMGRKLGVAVAMSFLTDNPYIKAAGAVMVLMAAYSVQLRLSPYRCTLYNRLENVCLLTSSLILFVSVIFQASEEGSLTRAIGVVGLLVVLFVTIVCGLAADSYAVIREERAVSEHEQTVGVGSVEGVLDERIASAQFDAAAASTEVATFESSVLGSSVIDSIVES